MTKTRRFAVALLAGVLAIHFATAKEGPEVIKDAPVPALKIDRVDVDQLPRNFRMGTDAFKSIGKSGVSPTRAGMDKLNLSGSSTFSELEFTKILATVPVSPDKFYVIDLRGESHGYLNGTAVSWFTEHNWGNDGRSAYIINHVETDQLKQAKKDSPVSVYQFDDKTKNLLTPIQITVDRVRNEEQLVTEYGAHYFRVPLSDYFPPDDSDVDNFLTYYKSLPQDAWLHYHCHAGIGRTTIFMIMHDILKNASKVSFNEIVERQALIGVVDLSDIPPRKKNWGRKVYIERYRFTKHFYDYVKAHPKLDIPYSKWTKQHDYESYTPDYSGFFWKVDIADRPELPRNFRTSLSPYGEVAEKYRGQLDPNHVPSRKGLDTLNISGSGQCSVKEFEALIAELKKYAKGPIYNIDIRQETHGFFNGHAVSWYGYHNWANIGKKDADIIQEEKKQIKAHLKKDVLIADISPEKTAENPRTIRVTEVMTEEDLAKKHGVQYVRITALDHVWPAPKYIDQFMEFYKTLPENAWLHFHCQAGKGRTTAYMIMTDMLKNPDVSFIDILQRQHMIGGAYTAYILPNPKPNDWKADYYADKARMVKLFYDYVQQNHADNFKTPWSKWLKENDIVR